MVPYDDRDAPTGDLLGVEALSPPPPQPATAPAQVINAQQATVSITTSGTAPGIAGIGKIAPSSPRRADASEKPRRKVVVVPTYSCSGGFDTKVRAPDAVAP